MSPQSKGRVVLVALAVLTAWPLVHTQLVRRHGLNPWKLGGWGMYSVPPIAPAGMEVIGRAAGGEDEQLTPKPALLEAGNALLERHRWLGHLTGSAAFAVAVFETMPHWTEVRIVVYQPVLRRSTGMIEMTEIIHTHTRSPTDPVTVLDAGEPVGISEPPSLPRFVDHGDGTVTDYVSGLVWEIKIEGLDCGHCLEDKHTWSATRDAPDGTVFTDFLDKMNGRCDGDEKTPCSADAECAGIGNGLCGHAGHRDWRLPTDPELRALLLEPFECSVSPCIDPSFPGGIKASAYWTSTPSRSTPVNARGVFFSNGFVGSGPKTGAAFVRAVRDPGGS